MKADTRMLPEDAIRILQRWRDETPDYEGNDPRANHYRRNRAALDMALAALSATPPVDGEAKMREALELAVDVLSATHKSPATIAAAVAKGREALASTQTGGGE